MAVGPGIELAGAERVDEVRELWLQLHHHHRDVDESLPLVEDDDLSWRRRRQLYLNRLEPGRGFLVLASDREAVVGTRSCASRKAQTTPSPLVIAMPSSTCCPSLRICAAAESERSCSTSSIANSPHATSATSRAR
jgi:hypothetical protein